jgi:flagellar basal body rod protein FlgF
MAEHIPYKGRTLDVFADGDGWTVHIIDAQGRRSIAKARTIERAINTAFQAIDDESAAQRSGLPGGSDPSVSKNSS